MVRNESKGSSEWEAWIRSDAKLSSRGRGVKATELRAAKLFVSLSVAEANP